MEKVFESISRRPRSGSGQAITDPEMRAKYTFGVGVCFRALWSDDVKSEGTSRVTWEIEQIEDSCRLVVTHDQLREDADNELYRGWPMVPGREPPPRARLPYRSGLDKPARCPRHRTGCCCAFKKPRRAS